MCSMIYVGYQAVQPAEARCTPLATALCGGNRLSTPSPFPVANLRSRSALIGPSRGSSVSRNTLRAASRNMRDKQAVPAVAGALLSAAAVLSYLVAMKKRDGYKGGMGWGRMVLVGFSEKEV